MKKLFIVAIFAGLLAGCTAYAPTQSSSLTHTETDIVLHENDFMVAQTHVVGSAECAYVLGSIALGDPFIVSNAWQQLRDQAQENAEGQPAQFVNVTEDFVTAMNIGIYRIDRYVVSADVLQFTQ